MSMTGCYELHAYCESVSTKDGFADKEYMRHQFPENHDPASDGGARFGPHPQETIGANKRAAEKSLRAYGWVITRDGRAFCPGCVELGRHK